MSQKTIQVGDEVTVSHHYGHTRVNDVFKVTDIEVSKVFKSGIAVKVDGLPRFVDLGLINLKSK